MTAVFPTDDPAYAGPILQAVDLEKDFGAERVLRGVSLDVGKGEAIAIIGGSGSGKSTFLRCLNLLETPTSGSIRLFGKDLASASRAGSRSTAPSIDRVLKRQVGMVFQQFNLWPHMSVLRNVAEAPRRVLKQSKAEAEALARAELEKVDLLAKADAYPAELSGGQKQRVAIARTLAMKPAVVLFDEVTSSLDPELTGEVLRVMRALKDDGMTMLIVTHEMEFARDVADRILFFDEGVIAEEGPARELFANPRTERCRRFLASARRIA